MWFWGKVIDNIVMLIVDKYSICERVSFWYGFVLNFGDVIWVDIEKERSNVFFFNVWKWNKIDC